MTTTENRQAGRREWIGLAVLALACLLYVMDLTVLHLAVPSISEDLKPSSSQLLWIIDIYGFMVAGFLITMGTLGDRIGRRKLLLIGAAAFGALSLLAAFSTSPEMLIVSRALLGIAGATLAPSTLSLIFSMFPDPKQRAVAIGVWISAFSAGSAVGPVLGGILLEHFWWGSVFLLALPVMAPAARSSAPSSCRNIGIPTPGASTSPVPSMSLVAVLAVIFGLKQIAQDGFGPLPIASIAARPGRRLRVGPPAALAGRPDDRPEPLPHPVVQRVAGHQLPGHLRGRRLLPVRGPVPAARGRAVAAPGRPVVACPRRSASSSGRTWLRGSCSGCGRPT